MVQGVPAVLTFSVEDLVLTLFWDAAEIVGADSLLCSDIKLVKMEMMSTMA